MSYINYMLFSYILCRQYSHPGLSTVSTVSRIRASQQTATTLPSFTRPEAKVQCSPSECGVFDDQSDPNQKIVALLGVWVSYDRSYIVNVIQQNLLPTLVKTTNIASSLPKDPHETARRGFTAMRQSSLQAERAQPCLNLVISEIQPRKLDNLTTSLDNPNRLEKGVDIKRGVKSHQVNPSVWSSVCRFFFRVSECCQYQKRYVVMRLMTRSRHAQFGPAMLWSGSICSTWLRQSSLQNLHTACLRLCATVLAISF